MIDRHSEVTCRIFDLGDEVEKMYDGEIDWDTDRLEAISKEMVELEAELESL